MKPLNFDVYLRTKIMRHCIFLFLTALTAGQLAGQSTFSSRLPILLIETNGQSISDEPKITASMRIISGAPGQVNLATDAATEYDGQIGIEVRGKSSAWYPQKPYGIETRDAAGNNRNVSIFGWPEENDWILLSNYNDRSLIRNMLSFNLFRAMGHYAPRARLVEVLLNGNYQGIYLFCEKIKRDKGRVDIANLTPEDISGDDLTGGYIFKADYANSFDSWISPYKAPDYPTKLIRFVYESPDPAALAPAQRQYLSEYVTAFERALYGPDFRDTSKGYAKYIDVPSFIDYLIVQEVSRNIDGFKKSSFFHKDKDSKNSRIHAGPVWDFDWAWKNIDECLIFAATDGSGYAHRINACQGDLPAPGWFPRLLADTAFSNRLRCRYMALRKGPLSTARLHQWMDSIATSVQTEQVRHFQRWNILGVNTSTPEVPPIPGTYNGEISKLKTWIELRLNWLDRNMPGRCGPQTDTDTLPEATPVLVPNPARDFVELRYRTADMHGFILFDVAGRQLTPRRRFDTERALANVSDLPAGVYFLQPLRVDGKKAGAALKLMIER
jgi:hypothetical protein